MVLATRIERQDNPAIPVVKEMIEAEFSRLVRRGVFSLTAPSVPD